MKRGVLCSLCITLMVCGGAHPTRGEIVVDGKQVLVGGAVCAAGRVLVGFDVDGNPQCPCFPGFAECGGPCADLSSDPANCGTCGSACDSGSACVEGYCIECSLAEQDCAMPGDGCFTSLTTALTVCEASLPTDPPGEQGNSCMFINDCAEGFGCVLPNAAMTGSVCARFCDPDRTFPFTGDEVCASEAGMGFRCVRATEFYSDGIGPHVAFCAGPEWFP